MTDEELLKELLEEQKFPYENMNKEYRNYCLNIIKNCKDVCDSDNKVNGIGFCEILEAKLVKKEEFTTFNGSMMISNEVRTMNGLIFIKEDRIIVDMQITRYFDDTHKTYTTLDEFKLKNNKLIRRSQYNYNMQSITEEIKNNEMKGKLK